RQLLRVAELVAGGNPEGLEVLNELSDERARQLCQRLGFTALYECVRMVKRVEHVDMTDDEYEKLFSFIPVEGLSESLELRFLNPTDASADTDLYKSLIGLLKK